MYKKLDQIIESKYFYLFLLVLIFIIGFNLRFDDLMFKGGLAYDEASTYLTARHFYLYEVIERATRVNLHAPLHYIYLHFWLNLFGNEDLTLRISSFVLGMMIIPVAYLTGKEAHSPKLGLILAALTSVNSFLIFFSVFLKFYSLLQLLGFISLLLLLRIKNSNDNSIKNFVALFIVNVLILYTYTTGFVFVCAEYLVFALYLFYKKKEQLKKFLISGVCSFIMYIPYLPALLYTYFLNQNGIVPRFWWIKKDFISIETAQIFTDWFTPEQFNSFGLDSFLFCLFIFIPTVIGITACLLAALKNRFIAILMSIGLIFIGFQLIGAHFEILTIRSRYTSLIFPIFLLAVAYGLMSIKNRKLSAGLITYFIVANLTYCLLFPYSSHVLDTYTGTTQIPARIVNKLKLSPKDVVFTLTKGDQMRRYLREEPELISLKLDEAYKLNYFDVLKLFLDQQTLKVVKRENSYAVLKNYLLDKNPSKVTEEYLLEKICKLEKGSYFVVVNERYPNSYTGTVNFTREKLRNIVTRENTYNKTPLFMLLHLKANLDVLDICQAHLHLVKKIRKQYWEVYVFKKDW